MDSHRVRRLLFVVLIVSLVAAAIAVLLDRVRSRVPPIALPEIEKDLPSLVAGDCRRDPARLPAPPDGPDGRPSNYLHTCGNRIYDSSGRPVRITGLNWFGMESASYAPYGLQKRNWRDLLDQIAVLGYNTIRLPFSNESLEPGRRVRDVNFDVNYDLEGLTGLEMMDRVIAGARERGLKVILDRHRPTPASWSTLWYNREVPDERWIADWRMLAARYRGNDTVIAFDLHNEPRGEATWGDGDPSTDWRLAAERAGNAILEENPYLLIFVEGIEHYNGERFWWGGELQGVRTAPVRLRVPKRVVYSPHDYGPNVSEQDWFWHPRFPANLPAEWDRQWGYIHSEGIAPVVVGEFGGRSVGTDPEGQWQRTLLSYLRSREMGALVWALNPEAWDTGGILASNWRSVELDKHEAYRQILAAPIDTGLLGTFGLAPSRMKVLFRQRSTEPVTSQVAFTFRIVNDGPRVLDLSRLELRYWVAADRAPAPASPPAVESTQPPARDVLLDFVPTGQGGQSHFLRVRFDPSAGTVGPYRMSGDLSVSFRRSDQPNTIQSSDYSYSSIAAPDGRLREWDRVTLYYDGQLVWGREP